MKDDSGRRWTQVHNGTIFDYRPLEKFTQYQSGDTDSERILLYLVQEINQAQALRRKPLSGEERFWLLDDILVSMSKGNKLNLLIYDGEYMYVHTNYADSLYYKEIDGGQIFATGFPSTERNGNRCPLRHCWPIRTASWLSGNRSRQCLCGQ